MPIAVCIIMISHYLFPTLIPLHYLIPLSLYSMVFLNFYMIFIRNTKIHTLINRDNFSPAFFIYIYFYRLVLD